MKGVMANVSDFILEWRKKTGAHKFDEMWAGVLHMPPTQNRVQQDFEASLETWLRLFWAPLHDARAYHQINVASVGGWPNDYRVPDLVLLLPQSFAIDRNEYFEGAPDVVVEIRNPGDETYDKFDFYAALGVPEVWVIDRDTRVPEVHRLRRGGYKEQPAGKNGWLKSSQTGVELMAGEGNRLAIRLAGDEASRQDLPSN